MCYAGQQKQTGKVSSTSGQLPQQRDAAIYTGSHFLDTHLQNKTYAYTSLKKLTYWTPETLSYNV